MLMIMRIIITIMIMPIVHSIRHIGMLIITSIIMQIMFIIVMPIVTLMIMPSMPIINNIM